jgi:hypothetical protein
MRKEPILFGSMLFSSLFFIISMLSSLMLIVFVAAEHYNLFIPMLSMLGVTFLMIFIYTLTFILYMINVNHKQFNLIDYTYNPLFFIECFVK